MFKSPVHKVRIIVFKINILPLVLYVYETRSLTLKEANKLQIFVKLVGRLSGSITVLLTSFWEQLSPLLYRFYTDCVQFL
jgi:hypothetical protein